jgi:uncharacterized protein YdiU (UPF0061 family)
VQAPGLIGWSEELAADLGIQKPATQEEINVLGGNALAAGMKPYAACYGGHQFGHWAGQLGDGRAITLGEWIAPDGSTRELQLKGAGMTPYSRRADGRAVLRSSVREYLMSEAMYHLGVPTTRALSLVTTGDAVVRDMFYDGHPLPEPGAIVMRVAPSFLRFGNFEILFARKEHEHLRKLSEWTMDRYYPHLAGSFEDRVVAWVKEIVARTARMISEWMRVGFVHGVMNTDNMSILGLTIDYGPYSMLDDYDAAFTPNTTDLPGRRYAFGRQPAIGKWNLACLAGSLAPLLPDAATLAEALQTYDDVFGEEYYRMMGRKLGFAEIGEQEAALVDECVEVLSGAKPDYTLFFLKLAELPLREDVDAVDFFSSTFYREPAAEARNQLSAFVTAYSDGLRQSGADRTTRLEIMRTANPRIILRNYQLHEAIEALGGGDAAPFEKLQQAMKQPYSDGFDELVAKRPDWAGQKAGCSMLSCSS